MAKTTAAFKLSRTAKCLLATISDKHVRGAVKRILIDGEVAKEAASRIKPRVPREQE